MFLDKSFIHRSYPKLAYGSIHAIIRPAVSQLLWIKSPLNVSNQTPATLASTAPTAMAAPEPGHIPDLINICACSTNCKSRLWMCKLENLNTQIPERYWTWYFTSNKGRFPSYFWIMIPGRVIRRNLLAMEKQQTYFILLFTHLSCLLYRVYWCIFSKRAPAPMNQQ